MRTSLASTSSDGLWPEPATLLRVAKVRLGSCLTARITLWQGTSPDRERNPKPVADCVGSAGLGRARTGRVPLWGGAVLPCPGFRSMGMKILGDHGQADQYDRGTDQPQTGAFDGGSASCQRRVPSALRHSTSMRPLHRRDKESPGTGACAESGGSSAAQVWSRGSSTGGAGPAAGRRPRARGGWRSLRCGARPIHAGAAPRAAPRRRGRRRRR